MLFDEVTQTETKQELAKNRGVTTEHETTGKKEEAREALCGVSELHGHHDSSNSK